MNFTLIVPFYRNQGMLERQIQEWNKYPKGVRIILVDDCSPEPAEPIVRAFAAPETLSRIAVYRIGVNVEWNRGEARNIGARYAETDWILHVDIDHILPAQSVEELLAAEVSPAKWYRFRRYRVGKADETRNKDALPRDADWGEIKPHGDSYLVTKDLYWKAGGYNLAFSGCLGGGSPFLQELGKVGKCEILPMPLHVYTRDKVADASDHTLSRDTSEYARRKAAMRGNYKGVNPIRSPWVRVI